MSTDTDAGRDLEAELEQPQAGQSGLAVDAVCVGCTRVRAKLVAGRDADDTSSFKHVCHRCRRVTFWNIVRVLERGTDE